MKRVKKKRKIVICVLLGFIFCFIGESFCSAENTSAASGDTPPARQWNLDYMDVQEAWDLIDKVKPKSGRGEKDKVIVATLDTGIDYEHPDLGENIDTENCVTVAGKTPPYKVYKKLPSSHGTGTAGIIAATSGNGIGVSGVAAGNHNDLISLMGINVFRNGTYTSQGCAATEDIIKGLEYACKKGAKVINMCLGHSPSDTDYLGNRHDKAALEAAINDAVYNKDVVITCSAGNRGNSRPWYPSDFDAVVSVISTGKYRNAWSKDCKARRSNFGAAKDISAPGKFVYSTAMHGTYKKGAGTSLSSASVAGVAALVRYVNPDLTAPEVMRILYSTATDLYKPGYDIFTGYGNVNAYRAVAKAAGVKAELKARPLPKPASVKVRSAGVHSIRVSWEKVPRANGYRIYRSSKPRGKYVQIKKTTNAKTLSFKDTRRKFNQKYYYKVEAYGTSKDGKKVQSTASAKVSSKATCGVPKLKAKNQGGQTALLSWKKAPGADGYQLYRAAAKKGKYRLTQSFGSKTRTWKSGQLTPGKTYYYKIRAYRSRGGKTYYSEMSDCLSIKAGPAKPIFSLKKKGHKAVVKIKRAKSAKVAGYKIYRKVSGGKWKLVKTTSAKNRAYVDRKIKSGKKYSYRVRAYQKIQGKTVFSDYSKIKKKTF